MVTTEGSAQWTCINGKRRATVKVLSEPSGRWGWSATRTFSVGDGAQVDTYVKLGRAKTWAVAYRASMRAAERLLAMRESRADA